MTILHFDMPLNLAEKYGGWINRKLIEFYLNFCFYTVLNAGKQKSNIGLQ